VGSEWRRRAALAAVVAAVCAAAVPASALATEAGVQAHLLWSGVSASEAREQLDQARLAGARYVRVDVGWSTLMPERRGKLDRRYLRRIDRVVRMANRRQLELILTFWTTPCWASSAPDHLKDGCRGAWWDRGVERYPPRRAADYARSLARLVERYDGRVEAWEVWNEPNLEDFFVSGRPAADYARLLRAAYPAAKRAHHGTTVLGGSLADADFSFTRALFRHGVRNRFDAWSIHPYTHDNSPLHPGGRYGRKKSFVRGIPAVRRVLEGNGDREPLWLTEFGWSTCTVRNHPDPWENCVSEEAQARYLTLAYGLMQRWAYVDVGVWFKLLNGGTNPADRIQNYGLLRVNGSPKPAYGAFVVAAASVHATDPLAPLRDRLAR
jgi:hypothetical protein